MQSGLKGVSNTVWRSKEILPNEVAVKLRPFLGLNLLYNGFLSNIIIVIYLLLVNLFLLYYTFLSFLFSLLFLFVFWLTTMHTASRTVLMMRCLLWQ